MTAENLKTIQADTLRITAEINRALMEESPNAVVFSLAAAMWGYYVSAPQPLRRRVRELIEGSWEDIRQRSIETVAAMENPENPEFQTPAVRLSAEIANTVRERGRSLTCEEILEIAERHEGREAGGERR